MEPGPSCVLERCTALLCTEISLFDRARETEGSAPSSVDRCLEKGLRARQGQGKAAQRFGQVSTARHMDTNWGGVKDCNSTLPTVPLARFRCSSWLGFGREHDGGLKSALPVVAFPALERAEGPSGRAQSRPASCGKSTGLPCSILLIPGNLKPLWRSHWSQTAASQLVGGPTATGGIVAAVPDGRAPHPTPEPNGIAWTSTNSPAGSPRASRSPP